MPSGAGPLSLEVAVDLQAYLTTAREVIPVFTSALARTSLLRSGLSLLQFKLLGLSNPHDFLTLDTSALSKMSSCLQDLFRQLDGLIDGDVQEKAKYFRSILQQLIASQPDDGQHLIKELRVEDGSGVKENHKPQHEKQKDQEPRCKHRNLEAIQNLLSFRSLLESGDVTILSEYRRTLSNLTSGSMVNLTRALEKETEILQSCEILQLAMDRASPESAADIKSLIMAKDPTDDQADDVVERVDAANTVCDHLQQVYELLSKQLHDCKPPKHIVKLHLSGLGGGRIGFLLSKCNGAQGWHPVPCRIQHEEPTMPPFRGCKDFRRAEAVNTCLTLNFGKAPAILTESVPESSELAQVHGVVPEKLLTLKEVLSDNDLANNARSSINTWSIGRWLLDLWPTTLSAPEQESNDRELNYKEALMENVVTVQYLLSESVFHLYCSPWLLDVWQPDLIEFPKDGTLLDFKRPYYPSPLSVELLKESQRASLDPSDYAETFMAKFGLLLLQLQLQKTFPLEEEDQNEDIWASIALGRYYDQFKDLVEPIKDVVVACLDFRALLFRDLDSRERSAAFKFRMVFYKKILLPLRDMLLLNCPKVAMEIQNRSALNTPQSRVSASLMGCNGAAPSPESCLKTVGETMLTRPSPSASAEWFNSLDNLSEFLTAHTGETNETYQTSRVKVAVIDSGLHEQRQSGEYITYKSFIENWNTAYKDDSQHGTNSVDLIRKVYDRAELYVAKVFQGNEADGNTPTYMAKAIEWAISNDVDIISISAGFKGDNYAKLKKQIERATAGGEGPQILVFAAASNWQNIRQIAFPARMADRVICIFCCNGGLVHSRHWNPDPRKHAANFTMLGEDVDLGSGRRLAGGTSVSTAMAAGLAAKLLDFSRQPDVQMWMSQASRDKMQTKSGMSAILEEMARKNTNEGYQCLAPWEILPADLADRRASGTVDRGRVRDDICTIIKQAMKNA